MQVSSCENSLWQGPLPDHGMLSGCPEMSRSGLVLTALPPTPVAPLAEWHWSLVHTPWTIPGCVPAGVCLDVSPVFPGSPCTGYGTPHTLCALRWSEQCSLTCLY